MAIPILHWPVTVQKYSQPMKEISEFSSDKQNNFFKKKSNINGILPISQTASKLEQKDLKIYDLNPNSPLQLKPCGQMAKEVLKEFRVAGKESYLMVTLGVLKTKNSRRKKKKIPLRNEMGILFKYNISGG